MSYGSIAIKTSRYPLNIVRLELANPMDALGDYFSDYMSPFIDIHP